MYSEKLTNYIHLKTNKRVGWTSYIFRCLITGTSTWNVTHDAPSCPRRFTKDDLAIWRLRRRKNCCSFRRVRPSMPPAALCQAFRYPTRACRRTTSRSTSVTCHSQVNSNVRLAAPHDAFCPRVHAYSLYFVFTVNILPKFLLFHAVFLLFFFFSIRVSRHPRRQRYIWSSGYLVNVEYR